MQATEKDEALARWKKPLRESEAVMSPFARTLCCYWLSVLAATTIAATQKSVEYQTGGMLTKAVALFVGTVLTSIPFAGLVSAIGIWATKKPTDKILWGVTLIVLSVPLILIYREVIDLHFGNLH
ncbi:MAG TPA: hypothetical protein VFF16_14645 [Telluria sp.]|nr:hypothetical protein [Telluria sp.]